MGFCQGISSKSPARAPRRWTAQGIAGGAVVYVVSDEGFRIEGYTWLLLYFAWSLGVGIGCRPVLGRFLSDWMCFCEAKEGNLASSSGVFLSSAFFGGYSMVEPGWLKEF